MLASYLPLVFLIADGGLYIYYIPTCLIEFAMKSGLVRRNWEWVIIV